jgi:hypothetical protein
MKNNPFINEENDFLEELPRHIRVKIFVAVNNSLITYSTKGQEIWLSPFLSHKLTINQRIIYS